MARGKHSAGNGSGLGLIIGLLVTIGIVALIVYVSAIL